MNSINTFLNFVSDEENYDSDDDYNTMDEIEMRRECDFSYNTDNHPNDILSFSLLQYVKDQNEDLVMKFIEQDPTAIVYSQFQTPQICLKVVQLNGYLIEHIYPENRSYQICCKSLKYTYSNLKYIDPLLIDENMIKIAIKYNNYDFLPFTNEKIDDNFLIEICKKNSFEILSLKNHNIPLSYNVYYETVKKFPHNYIYVPKNMIDDKMKKLFPKYSLTKDDLEEDKINILQNTFDVDLIISIIKLNPEYVNYIDKSLIGGKILENIARLKPKLLVNFDKINNQYDIINLISKSSNYSYYVHHLVNDLDVIEKIIEIDPFYLQYVPPEVQTYEMVLKAINENIISIQYANKEFINYDLYIKCMEYDASFLYMVPYDIQTYDMCALALKYDGNIGYVNPNFLDYELCKIAVKHDCFAFSYIYDNFNHFVTQELFDISIKNNRGFYIINKYPMFQTIENVKYAISKDVKCLKYVRDDLKNYQLYMYAVNLDSYSLKYINNQELDYCVAAMDSPKHLYSKKFKDIYSNKKILLIKNHEIREYCIQYLLQKCIKSFY